MCNAGVLKAVLDSRPDLLARQGIDQTAENLIPIAARLRVRFIYFPNVGHLTPLDESPGYATEHGQTIVHVKNGRMESRRSKSA
jgi:hypothetical protein